MTGMLTPIFTFIPLWLVYIKKNQLFNGRYSWGYFSFYRWLCIW